MLHHFLEKLDRTKTISESREIIVFGTGEGGKYLDQLLTRIGVEPIFFVDNNSEKWGTHFEGKTIENPMKLLEMSQSQIYILIASVYYREIHEQLTGMGFEPSVHFSDFILNHKAVVFVKPQLQPPIPIAPGPSDVDIVRKELLMQTLIERVNDGENAGDVVQLYAHHDDRKRRLIDRRVIEFTYLSGWLHGKKTDVEFIDVGGSLNHKLTTGLLKAFKSVWFALESPTSIQIDRVVNLHIAPLVAITMPGRTFSLITCFNPIMDMQIILDLLAPGGFLLISLEYHSIWMESEPKITLDQLFERNQCAVRYHSFLELVILIEVKKADEN